MFCLRNRPILEITGSNVLPFDDPRFAKLFGDFKRFIGRTRIRNQYLVSNVVKALDTSAEIPGFILARNYYCKWQLHRMSKKRNSRTIQVPQSIEAPTITLNGGKLENCPDRVNAFSLTEFARREHSKSRESRGLAKNER
jgi:hypothetical protein